MKQNKLIIKSNLYSYRVNFKYKIKNLNKKILNSFFIIDDKIFYKYKLQKKIPKGKYILIKSNEKSKSFENLFKVINFFLNKNINRKDIIFAIGGGVIQDITGFVASILLRGIEWRFFPTTILSQCDSCIGGKTSINFSGVKNKIGNFYPPKEIYIDKTFIKTLNDREIRSGIGEMAHYFFVKDKISFNFFNKNFKMGVNKNLSVLSKLIYKSLLIKKTFIEKDEFDKGPRLILNYGHSFGHALEKVTNYQLAHGIAVAHGMNIANFISWKKKFITLNEFKNLNQILKTIWGKYNLKSVGIKKYIEALKKDKKNIKNLVRVILTKGVGKMFIYEFKETKQLKKILIEYFKYNQIKVKI